MVNRGKYDYFITPEQQEFISLDSRWSGFVGGIRSGKTYAGALKMLLKCVEPQRAGLNALVGGATYPMLRDAIIPTVLEVFPRELIIDYNQTNSTMKLSNGITMFFRPLEIERHIDRIRGTEYNLAWLDEGAYLPKYAFDVVQGRLSQGKDARGWITTSPRGFNWVWDDLVNPERTTGYQAVIGVSSDKNPTLPKEWIEDIKRNYSEAYLQQEFYGKFVKFEGLVYPEFEETKHILPEHIADGLSQPNKTPLLGNIRRYIYGYDAGYRNPRVYLEIAITTEDVYVVTREWYKPNWLLSESINTFTIGYHGGECYCDPSAKSDIEELRNKGIDADSAKNEVMGGIQHIKSLFTNNQLYVSERCHNLIKELQLYRWDKDKDQPVKEADHALDALRYAVYTDSLGFVPMATLDTR